MSMTCSACNGTGFVYDLATGSPVRCTRCGGAICIPPNAVCSYCNHDVYNPCKNEVEAKGCPFKNCSLTAATVEHPSPFELLSEEELLSARRALEAFNIDDYGLAHLIGNLPLCSHPHFLRHLSEAKEDAIAAIKDEQVKRVTKGA